MVSKSQPSDLLVLMIYSNTAHKDVPLEITTNQNSVTTSPSNHSNSKLQC